MTTYYWDHFDNFGENFYFDTFENDTFESVIIESVKIKSVGVDAHCHRQYQ